MATNSIYRAAEKAFGKEALLADAVEKCNHLQAALNSALRRQEHGERSNTASIAKEMAAMKVLIERITDAFDLKQEVEACRADCLNRLQEAIMEHYAALSMGAQEERGEGNHGG